MQRLSNNLDRAFISGLGEVAPVRRSGLSAERLALDAIGKALNDAGVAPSQIDAIVTESSICPQMTPIDRIAIAAGIHALRRVAHTTPVGAGILAAIGTACEMVAAGQAQHVLTYFAVDWGSNSSGPTEYHTKMSAKRVVEEPAGFAGPPLYFAMIAKRYQHVYGLDDRQMTELLGTIAMSARSNAMLHPEAQVTRPLDREQYEAARMIADPLRGADCSLLSDGAVAIIVSRLDEAPARRRSEAMLHGWSYAVDPVADMAFYTQAPALPELPAASRASAQALANAGMTVMAMDMFQIYDCFSIAVPLQLEAIGRIPFGQSHARIQQGVLGSDGAIPTNTHGGLLSHGYLLGAGHIVEAVRQLRGEAGRRQVGNARTAFVGAGPGRQYTALVLGTRERTQ